MDVLHVPDGSSSVGAVPWCLAGASAGTPGRPGFDVFSEDIKILSHPSPVPPTDDLDQHPERIAVSVVIPAFNRRAVLQRTLTALLEQERTTPWGPLTFEIIVVDDGSSDDIRGVVAQLAGAELQEEHEPGRRNRANECEAYAGYHAATTIPAKQSARGDQLSPVPSVQLRYVRQQNRGAGAARNHGLSMAKGWLVLFLDSDIVASPTLITEHWRSHRQLPDLEFAVLGQVRMAPELPPTPLNRRHAVHKWQELEHGAEVGWQYFATGNISLKQAFLKENDLWFDENLSFPAYDDTELGYRCHCKGLRIHYNARALGYHLHPIELDGYLRMCRRGGEALALLHYRYPQLRGQLARYLVDMDEPQERRRGTSASLARALPEFRNRVRSVLRPLFLNRVSVVGLTALLRWYERQGDPNPLVRTAQGKQADRADPAVRNDPPASGLTALGPGTGPQPWQDEDGFLDSLAGALAFRVANYHERQAYRERLRQMQQGHGTTDQPAGSEGCPGR